MTVKQLINKLKKIPEDTIITVANTDVFVNGDYIATGILYYADAKTVSIETDYKKAIWTD